MNLLNKISVWFIAIVLLVTPVSMYISYTGIKKRLDSVEIERLKSVNSYVISQLRKGETPAKTSQGLPITISPFQGKIFLQNRKLFTHVLKIREFPEMNVKSRSTLSQTLTTKSIKFLHTRTSQRQKKSWAEC